jgi:hypothetical protein
LSLEEGFKQPPSPIALFRARITDTVRFVAGSPDAEETVLLEEDFKMRDGSERRCRTELKLRANVRFGRRRDEAAVEIRSPGGRAARECGRGPFAEAALELPARAARFGLRGDQLVAVEPATERRAFLPIE